MRAPGIAPEERERVTQPFYRSDVRFAPLLGARARRAPEASRRGASVSG